MKTTNFLKIVTCSLTLMALMSVTAFATTGQPQPAAGNDPAFVIASELNNSAGGAQADKESAAKNITTTGKVTDVQVENGSYTIVTGDMNTGIVFHVQPGVFVLDQKTGEYLSVKDIKKDMTITAVYPKNSPMTMSLPPQTSAATGFIINSNPGFVDLSVYNDELVNEGNTLKLNVDDKTHIVDAAGTKKAFSAEDLKGSECLVLYTASTKSIPAQASPELVMILNTKAALGVGSNDSENSNGGNDSENSLASYVELRSGAEAKGYSVTWESATKPIVLEKDDMTVKVTIGSDAFQFEHKTKDIKPLDQMKKLDLMVKLENGKTMVPNTFVEAL